MKITPSTERVSVSLDYPYDGYVTIFFETYFGEKPPRVIEFPKVWRENGKQYKVAECAYRRWGSACEYPAPTIKVPEGVGFANVDGDCKVVRY